MRVPSYWARADFTANDRAGRPVHRSALGWSHASQAEAQAMAGERANRAARRAVDDPTVAYEYGHIPLREPLVSDVRVGDRVVGQITRNRYGCLVLNTDRVLFADIDFAPPRPALAGVAAWVAGLFSKRPVTSPEQTAIDTVTAWQAARPSASCRLYRTFGGLRLLFTDRFYDPASADVREMLRSLAGDPLYYTLTQRQGCFRARLTPKPWRCGVARFGQRSWIDHPDEPQRVAQWAAAYDERAARYRTCRFVRVIGGGQAANEEIAAVVDVHDRLTGATASDLPLA